MKEIDLTDLIGTWPFPIQKRRKQVYWFKKGEIVPDWIFKVSFPLKQTRLKFGTDIVVEEGDFNVDVYPENVDTQIYWNVNKRLKNTETIIEADVRGRTRIDVKTPVGKQVTLHDKKYGT